MFQLNVNVNSTALEMTPDQRDSKLIKRVTLIKHSKKKSLHLVGYFSVRAYFTCRAETFYLLVGRVQSCAETEFGSVRLRAERGLQVSVGAHDVIGQDRQRPQHSEFRTKRLAEHSLGTVAVFTENFNKNPLESSNKRGKSSLKLPLSIQIKNSAIKRKKIRFFSLYLQKPMWQGMYFL